MLTHSSAQDIFFPLLLFFFLLSHCKHQLGHKACFPTGTKGMSSNSNLIIDIALNSTMYNGVHMLFYIHVFVSWVCKWNFWVVWQLLILHFWKNHTVLYWVWMRGTFLPADESSFHITQAQLVSSFLFCLVLIRPIPMCVRDSILLSSWFGFPNKCWWVCFHVPIDYLL